MPTLSSSSAPGGIHTPGSIWNSAIDQLQSNKQAGRADAHVYFVGASSSGKSTLISRFLYPNKAEVPKPSPGLDYIFARKANAYDASRKDVAHIWELAGGDALTPQLTQGGQIFLSHKQVTTAVVVIVLDLSEPGSVLSQAQHWLSVVRQKLATTYTLFEKRGLQQLPQQLRTRQRNKVLTQQHQDAALVDCPGITLVLACTKWDTLRNSADPDALRVLSHALRWLAHSNAAHLVYLGGLQPGGGGSESTKQLDSFSRLLNHLAFVGMDRRIPLKHPSSVDHMGPLLVPAGFDSYSSIGLPHGGTSSGWDTASIAAGQQQWLEAVGRVLPAGGTGPGAKQQQQQQQAAAASGRNAAAFSATYAEEEVDAAYHQRDAALDAYKQELEERLQAQRASRRKAGPVIGAQQ